MTLILDFYFKNGRALTFEVEKTVSEARQLVDELQALIGQPKTMSIAALETILPGRGGVFTTTILLSGETLEAAHVYFSR